MFASIRRCRMQKGSIDELARRVDEGFAEEISAQPGFVSYEFVDCGEKALAYMAANPVDVISSNKHVVKPWYQGKLPFTFNPPEAAADPSFVLIGGRLVYAQHSPGAELVYQVRQHKISVFIFQARDVHGAPAAGDHAFTVSGWQQGGLQYYIVTDAAREDADRLRSLLEEANRS